MKKEVEIPKICAMFSAVPSNHCTALEQKYYKEYKVRGQCGTTACPFFKPGNPGEGRKLVRKEHKNGKVYFEPFERKEYYNA